MTGLRESISLRGYAQKDPKQEYKREAYSLFVKMMHNIKMRMMTQVCRVQIEKPDFSRLNQAAKADAARRQQRSEAPVDHEEQVKELQSMANASRVSQPRKAMSMADLMPVSIAKAAAAQRVEQPKKTMSMADLMPVSMRQTMQEAKEQQRKMMERMRQAEEAAAQREAEQQQQAALETPKAEAEPIEKEAEPSEKVDEIMQDEGAEKPAEVLSDPHESTDSTISDTDSAPEESISDAKPTTAEDAANAIQQAFAEAHNKVEQTIEAENAQSISDILNTDSILNTDKKSILDSDLFGDLDKNFSSIDDDINTASSGISLNNNLLNNSEQSDKKDDFADLFGGLDDDWKL
jgi:hypothetical protein